MKAMVLAAGKGTRVRPITNVVPKPMIPLLGKPILESILEHLRSNGFDEIMINTSHLAPVIQNYFRDGSRLGVQIAYSFEGLLSGGRLEGIAVGSAGGMRRIQDHSGFFDDTFVVLCGDALIDVDLSEAVRFHRERGAIATMILRNVAPEEVYRYGVVATASDGRVLQFQEKPLRDAISTQINTGIYIFEPAIFDLIPADRPFDIGSDVFPAMAAAGAPVFGIELPFQWIDIGSVAGDYWEATRVALNGQIRGYALPGREVAPGIHMGLNVRWNPDRVTIRGPVVIGGSSHLGDGCVIEGPTVIGAGCVIEPGAVVRECVLDDYTRVGSVAKLEQFLVYGNHCMEPSGEYLDLEEAGAGWVVDDARRQRELSDDELELLEVAQTLKD